MGCDPYSSDFDRFAGSSVTRCHGFLTPPQSFISVASLLDRPMHGDCVCCVASYSGLSCGLSPSTRTKSRLNLIVKSGQPPTST